MSTHCTGCGYDLSPGDRFCERCGLGQPSPRDRVELDLGRAAGISDRGLRHYRNEDALALRDCGDDTVVAVVCDGVSSSDRPDEASAVAAESAVEVLLADPGATARAVLVSASAVNALAGENAPACTYVSAVVTSNRITVCWVGDSRAYWLGEDTASCLTVDDSWAQEMVAAGQLDPAEAFTDPRAHGLTAWLGSDAEEIRPRVVSIEPTGPGVVLLCSDGLWNYLWESDALAERVRPLAANPLAAATDLVQFALDRGGSDNITVAVVRSSRA